MLTLTDISRFFPLEVRHRERGILREYLQYLILSSIYTSAYKDKLVFLWGTCLRIVYASQRFSEDIDFDNRGLTQDDFTRLWDHIAHGLRYYGLEVEVHNVFKWAFHCYIRIPKILFQYGMSGYEEEKILIQLDTVPQPIDYEAWVYILSGFGMRESILVTPKEVLLSQKITAAYSRKRLKGRDFYDIQFLASWGVKPYYPYLEATIAVGNYEKLRAFMHERNQTIDFDTLARDVEPFLFRSEDARLVRDFAKWEI